MVHFGTSCGRPSCGRLSIVAERERSVNYHASGVDTIVLIRGLDLTDRSWDHWGKRYTDRGYKVINERSPGLEGEVEELPG